MRIGTASRLWAISAPRVLLPAIDLLNRFVAEDLCALQTVTSFSWKHAAIADLSATEAASSAPAASIGGRREGRHSRGIVVRPDFTATLQCWRRPTGNAIVDAESIGALAQDWRDRLGRLSSALFAIAEAVAAVGESGEDRSGPSSDRRSADSKSSYQPAATGRLGDDRWPLAVAIDIIQSDAFSSISWARERPCAWCPSSTEPEIRNLCCLRPASRVRR